jgi:NAD(P)-dependent dehydrogenase (short-subunit alcohol dehydrogenase family)
MSCVLVTGSNRGIGLATALALGRTGHNVYATMRNLDRGGELRAAIAKEKLPIEVYAMDVDSDASVTSAIAAIRSKAGFVDCLVNNAGVFIGGSIEELGMDDFKAVMETNYFGAVRCIRALLPDMRKRRSGCVINVTSVAGRIALAPMAPYTASKFALEALSETLAQELKPFNIRVAIVEPGIIDTAMSRTVAGLNGTSAYPQTRRFAHFFSAALKTPADPSIVGETVRRIVESGTWQLRHPAGPDAKPFLDWRAGMADEQWVDWGGLDDDAWYRRVQSDFGFDARPSST